MKKSQNRTDVHISIDTLRRGWDCFQIESEVAQRKTAEQAEREYRARNKGRLAEKASVTYSVSMSPSHGRVSKGGVLVLIGHVEVVAGDKEKIDRVDEELVLTFSGSKGRELLQKFVKPMEGKGGAFETKHTITIPREFQDGQYNIVSRVLVNGEAVPSSKQSKTLQIAQLPQEEQMLAMAGF
jgi:hypothetical protein